MTGSLQIKKSTYYAVINVEDDCGNKKQKWISTKIKADGNNKRQAQKVLRDILKEYEDSKVTYSKEIYFSDWILQWLENMKYNIEQTSWESYSIFVNTHIVPYFKTRKITLTNLTPKHVQDYYLNKLKKGRCDGKGGLSANTVKKHSVIIRSALNEALKMNLIPYNPADRATLPKVEKFVGKHYNEGQAYKLMDASMGTTVESAILLTLHYGFRRSEVLGLKWDCIDFVQNTVLVKNTVVRVSTVIEKERTKNKSSYRTLPLIPEVKEYLSKLRLKQKENKLLYGNCYTDNDYICKWEDGHPFSPEYVSKKFKKILADANMPKIRFHDLRHTTASLLLSMGFSLKEIQEWLGHNDIGTTANIYGHLEYQSKVNMADKMGDTFKIRQAN